MVPDLSEEGSATSDLMMSLHSVSVNVRPEQSYNTANSPVDVVTGPSRQLSIGTQDAVSRFTPGLWAQRQSIIVNHNLISGHRTPSQSTCAGVENLLGLLAIRTHCDAVLLPSCPVGRNVLRGHRPVGATCRGQWVSVHKVGNYVVKRKSPNYACI